MTTPTTSSLSPSSRRRTLTDLQTRTLDVLVVGGGVVGAGAALDATTRGLDTALVEARDLASGTSSRSSKLMHGGLRYLEMLDFGLVAEALRERDAHLDRLAPHLVRQVPFLYPLKHRGWERLYAGAGVALYDAMSRVSRRSAGVPRHRHLTRRGALGIAPALREDALVGALQYFDAQVDDARHTMFLARTAAAHGAAVATRVQVVDLLREDGRVVGALARDLEDGSTITIRARVVVNATGVWTPDSIEMTGAEQPLRVKASKGVHLVVPRERIRSDSGLILRTDRSVLFVIPWGHAWIVGTTDTPWDHDRAHPAASARDVDYLLEEVNRVLVDPLTHDDVMGVYVGLRPLVESRATATTKMSREHSVAVPAPGLVVVAGGKYTTYRVMAEDAVDVAAEHLASAHDVTVPAGVTDRVPLLGAEGYQAAWNRRARIAAEWSVAVDEVERLLGRYGALAGEVHALVEEDPDLARPLEGAPHHRAAEVVYAVRHEGAMHLDDVLTRRTRISVETPDRGVASAAQVAALMAAELGWDAARTDDEVRTYRERVDAERRSQQAPDDRSADAARRSVADLVPTV